MYKLRKMYLGTIGNDSSWHNGTVLDCTKEDEPIDTYGCLTNGGGKTTLVGLFFSVPIPHKNKFIPHVVNNSLVMEDYYRTNVPGYVCLEWEFPTKTDGAVLPMAMGLMPKRRYVIGSIGYKSVISGVLTLERLFYSVRLSQNFDFDDLPLPIVNNAEASKIVDFDGVKKWASSMKSRLGDSFFSYQSHSDWQKHLESLGFNIHDFEVQMKMNYEEGGATKVIENLQSIETATSKRDFKFIEWMLNTVLDQDEYRSRRDDLLEVCKKLKDIPKAEEALNFLGSMKTKCAEISEILSEVRRYSNDLHSVNNDTEFVYQYLQQIVHDVNLTYNNEITQQAGITNLIKSLKTDLESVITRGESLSYVIAKRLIDDLEQKIEALNKEKTATEDEYNICKRVGWYFPTYLKSEKLKTIVKEINAAEDSDISKNLRSTIANTLHFINIEDDNNKASKKSYEESKLSQESALKKLRSDKINADKEESGLNKKHGVSQGWLSKAEEDRQELVKTGILSEDVAPNIQHEVVNEQIRKIDSDIEIWEQKTKQGNNEIRSLEYDVREKELEIRANKKKVQDLSKDLDCFHHQTKSIHEHRLFVHYLGESSSIDDNCVKILKQARIDRNKSIDNSIASLTVLEKNRVKAEKFNLPVSDDLWAVIFALSEADIKSIPAVSYIYESAWDNPEEIIAANDMFTQAVVVYDLDKAMTSLEKHGVTVLSPVYVLDAKNVLSFSGIDYKNVVHPCKFATNKDVSSKYVQNLDSQIEELRIAINESRKEADLILDFQNEIIAYLQKYDKSYAESIAAEIEKTISVTALLEASIATSKIKIGEIQESVETTRKTVIELRKEKEGFIDRRSKLHSFINSTWNLKPAYEEKTKNLKADWDAKKQEIAVLRLQISDTEAVLHTIETSIDKSVTRQNELDRHKRKINSIISDVEPNDNGSCLNVEDGVRKIDNLNEIYNTFLYDIGFKDLKAQADALSAEINEETDFFNIKSKHSVDEVIRYITINPDQHYWDEKNETLRAKEIKLAADGAKLAADLELAKKSVPAQVPPHESLPAIFLEASDEDLLVWQSECEQQYNSTKARLEEQNKSLAALSDSIATLRLKKLGFETNMQLFKKGVAPAQFCFETYAPVNDVVQNISEHSNYGKIKEVLFSLSDQISNEIEKLNGQYSDCFDDYKNMLATQSFEQMEAKPAFVEYAKRTTREGLREPGEIEKLVANIDDLINLHEQTLTSNKTYRQNAVETLIKMYQEGVMAIDKACSKSKIVPEGVRYIGGKQILKRTSDRNHKMGDEGVTTLCEMYLSILILSPNFPKSGIDIVLDLLRKTHESGFGFRLVKYAAIHSAQYESIEKLAMSGGERVLTAVMLYLLVRAVKAELNGSKEAPGGFLFFDNPFGKLTSPDFVETLKSIVAHAKCQLIAFSTIRTEAINSVFENFVIMAKATKLVGGTDVSLVNVVNENTIVINSASYTMRNHD